MNATARARDARDLARDALSDVADQVGDEFNVVDDADGLVTHCFTCTNPGYVGWYWAVTISAADGDCTVSEVALLPGSQALVPPAWKPWSSRVEPGDLGVGDLLPPPDNDERLTAGFTEVADGDLVEFSGTQWDLGLGREQVLSVAGVDRAVDRWMHGQTGPRAAMAKSAPAPCSTCGFLVAVGGSLGQMFGICANEFGAADGQLVAMSFGCGAHSSVAAELPPPVPIVDLVIDDQSDDLADASDLPDYVAQAKSDEDADSDEDDDVDALGGDSGEDDPDDDETDDEDSDDDESDEDAHESDFLDHIDDDSADWDPDEHEDALDVEDSSPDR